MVGTPLGGNFLLPVYLLTRSQRRALRICVTRGEKLTPW